LGAARLVVKQRSGDTRSPVAWCSKSQIANFHKRFDRLDGCHILPLDRAAFTLLEVLLALSLSILLLTAVSMAISIHLRVVDSGRRDVEQAQLARAILHRIADDLRSAVQYAPQDFESMASSAGAAEGETESTTGSTSDTSSTQEDSTTTDADAGASTAAPAMTPGLYGTQYEVEVDVARLPRIDQYQQLVSEDGAATDLVSDVKTVAYYVIEAGDSSIGSLGALSTTAEGGLVRREMDRAVTRYAAEQGTLNLADQPGELLAPEVVTVEFRYYDGTQWLTEWDSATLGGLPMAVEVAIAMVSDPSLTEMVTSGSLFDLVGIEQENYSVYRLLIQLPAAVAATESETTSTEDTSSSSMEEMP
jgi:hypothetical protein